MKNYFTLLFLFLLLHVQAQTPVLVQDYNTGDADAFDEFNFKGIFLGDIFMLPMSSSEEGQELVALVKGELSLIKDINPGTEGSNPTAFTAFKEKVYFSAFDSINGGAIWVSDGTADGTLMAIDPGNHPSLRPRGLIASASGYLYYTYDGQLFRTDGIQNEPLMNGVTFFTAFEQQSTNYTHYKDEIAFIEEVNDSIHLYTIENGAVKLLGSTPETSGFGDLFGLSPIKGGLIFGVDDSFDDDISGTYVYSEETGEVRQLQILGEALASSRLVDFNDTTDVALIPGRGYYALNGTDNGEQLLYSSTTSGPNQGAGIVSASHEGKIVFNVSEGGFFGDKFLLYSDGTSANSRTLFQLNSHISNMISKDNFAFLASGVSNGFEPKLYWIDLKNGIFQNVYNFTESSSIVNSILLLTLVGDRLYFMSGLDQTIGRELYSIDVNLLTSNRNIFPEKTFDVSFTRNSFEVRSDKYQKVLVNVFDASGRLLETINTQTNTIYDISHLRTLVVLQFEVNGQMVSHKFLGE